VAEVTHQDLAGYDDAYYQRDAPEFWFGGRDLPRPDQLAAICYTFGVPFWGSEPYAPRDPGRVVSIGCGGGHLEQTLEDLGVTVTGVDPSPGARRLYRGKLLCDAATPELIGSARTVTWPSPVGQVAQGGPGWDGKGGTAVPYLVGLGGYEIWWEQAMVVLRRLT
jgi:SAM-dependent methyltransferase